MQAIDGRRSTIQSMSGSVDARPPAPYSMRGAISIPRARSSVRVAAVRLEVADHEVDALLDCETRVAEHLVGLADARGGSEVDAQLPAREPRHVHEASLESQRGAPGRLYVRL